jgi:hypothetical protein
MEKLSFLVPKSERENIAQKQHDAPVIGRVKSGHSLITNCVLEHIGADGTRDDSSDRSNRATAHLVTSKGSRRTTK